MLAISPFVNRFFKKYFSWHPQAWARPRPAKRKSAVMRKTQIFTDSSVFRRKIINLHDDSDKTVCIIEDTWRGDLHQLEDSCQW